MPVLVNFKICDNAKECGGVAVCPTGALGYDEEKNSIVIYNEKCISCGICENECPIGAIMVAKNEEEHRKIQKEIDDDPRTTKDLFVDRYGAVGISEFFKIELEEIREKSKKDCITLVEVYNPDTAECLLKSIPIKELTKNFPKDTLYYKVESEKEPGEYEVKELPSLLIFKKGELLGHIDGYYTSDEKEELFEKIKKFI